MGKSLCVACLVYSRNSNNDSVPEIDSAKRRAVSIKSDIRIPESNVGHCKDFVLYVVLNMM